MSNIRCHAVQPNEYGGEVPANGRCLQAIDEIHEHKLVFQRICLRISCVYDREV